MFIKCNKERGGTPYDVLLLLDEADTYSYIKEEIGHILLIEENHRQKHDIQWSKPGIQTVITSKQFINAIDQIRDADLIGIYCDKQDCMNNNCISLLTYEGVV